MANFNKLWMAPAIRRNDCIAVRKTMLGLCTRLIYLPTGSIMDIQQREYSRENGECLRAIINGDAHLFADALDKLNPQPTVNGNYLLETAISRDHEMAAVQLLHFVNMNYEPVTEVLFYTGEQAQALARLA